MWELVMEVEKETRPLVERRCGSWVYLISSKLSELLHWMEVLWDWFLGSSVGAEFIWPLQHTQSSCTECWEELWGWFLWSGVEAFPAAWCMCWDEISDCIAQSVGAGEGLGAARVGWHKAQRGFVNLSALPLFPLLAACLINLRDLTPSL